MFDGYFHTDKLHTIERITRPNKGTLRYEVTIDDPGAYERPWTAAWEIRWTAGEQPAGIHLPGRQPVHDRSEG